MGDYHADHLLALQKKRTDYFYLWRDGDEQVFEYDEDRRRHVLQRMEFPLRGRWPGHRFRFAPGSRRPSIYRIQKPRTQDTGPRRNRDLAENIAAQMDAQLEFAGLRVTRILGWGGLGIACAVEGHRAKDGVPVKLVCKAALVDGGMGQEKRNHVLTAGARHVVQRVVLVDGPGPGEEEEEEGLGANGHANRRRMDASDGILVIEFMRYGDLDGILKRASERDTPFPDTVLWHIFHCLFRGVVGMAFPGAWRSPGNDPEREQTPQRTERIEGRPPLNSATNTMVHFDLDPLNVLVGDFDDDGGEHIAAPVVKIGDLGLAQNVDLQFRLHSRAMWQTRQCGKVHIYTPEQFAEEWDYVHGAPIYHPEPTERDPAGNYHWWTNMYQVAQVMWQLVTLCHLEWPPVLEDYNETLADGSETRRWSYGAALLSEEFDYADLSLRSLLVSCMNHNPTERPTMAEIDEVIRGHVDAHELSARERLEAQDFWDNIFAEPDPPSASQPADLAGVAAAAAAAKQDGPPLSFRPGASRDEFQAAGPIRPFPNSEDVRKQEKEFGNGWW